MLYIQLVNRAVRGNQIGLQFLLLHAVKFGIDAHVRKNFPPVFGVDLRGKDALMTFVAVSHVSCPTALQ